jgi:hypothetical protein
MLGIRAAGDESRLGLIERYLPRPSVRARLRIVVSIFKALEQQTLDDGIEDGEGRG